MTQIENKNNIEARNRTDGKDLVDILVFLIASLQFVKIKMVGVLYGSEMLILLVFVFLVFRLKVRIPTQAGKIFMSLCLLWLASQCVTDVVQHTAFHDYARGWSSIGMTVVDFVVLCTLLYERPRRIVIFGWGLAIGGLLDFLINPEDASKTYPWKFGIGVPVTLAVILIASRRECRGSLSAVLCVGIGGINILMGARNLGGACLAAGLYLAVTPLIRRRSSGTARLNARSILAILACIVLGLAGILWAYESAAAKGILGDEAREKYELQSSGKFGLLLGGREDLLGSIPAIYDSPILGHGSFARDPKYFIALQQSLALMGYKDAGNFSTEDFEEGTIPTHSYLFGAWVSAGILGALYWAWAWGFVLRSLFRVYPVSVTLLPLASFAAFSLLWDILFSPYGAKTRMVSSFFIIILMSCLSLASVSAKHLVKVKPKRPAKLFARRETLRESS